MTCACGNLLHLRVVGAAQRSGAEPLITVTCLHCPQCGDVTQRAAGLRMARRAAERR